MTKAVKQSTCKSRKKKIDLEIINNNEPDYENNLFFEPKMTWDDFINYCNNKAIEGLIDHDIFGEFLKIGKMRFYKSGTIKISTMIGIVSKNRTIEQYKAIIDNLYL